MRLRSLHWESREAAVDALQNVVRLLPGSADAVYALCWELERLGLYDEALEELRRYAKHDPLRNYSIYQHWGRIRGRQKRWKSAYASYVKCVRLNPPGREYGGHAPAAQRYKQIADIRRRAAKADPEAVHSFVNLGRELSAVEWDDAAIDVLGTAVSMRPDAKLYRSMGAMHEKHFRLAEAINTYRRGIRALSGTARPADLAPLYEGAVINLAKCGYRQEAIQYGKEAISLGIDRPNLLKYYNGIKSHAPSNLDKVRDAWVAPPYQGRLFIEP